MQTADFYETDKAISEYLLFHYAQEACLLENGVGPREALQFPKRCAELAWRHPLAKGRALDLGCAVGGSACCLSSQFENVVGIDFSHGLIDAANRLLSAGTAEIEIATEGELTSDIAVSLPPETQPSRVDFQQGDAMNVPSDLGTFDFVLMANLIDRLPDPAQCLSQIHELLNDGGVLAITSPYTWMESYTPKAKWLGGYKDESGNSVRAYQSLQSILSKHFTELESLNLPFLIREHARKSQFSVAHATLWRKR